MLDRKGDMVTSISTRLSTPITPVDDANLLEVDDGDARIEEIASSDHASIPSVPESTFCLSPQCGYSQWALGTRKPKPISSLRLPGYITNIYKSENMEITSKVLDPPTHEILEPKLSIPVCKTSRETSGDCLD